MEAPDRPAGPPDANRPLRARVAASTEAIREVTRNPDIRRLQVAWTAAIAADWALLVVVLVVAYEAAGAFGVGVLTVVRMVPATAAALFAAAPPGVRQERILVAINAIRAAAAAGAGLTLLVGGPVAAVFGCAAIVAAAGALARPTQTALLPALARTPGELIASNVASSTGEAVGTFVGPLGAALLIAAAGQAPTAAVAGAVFAAAAVVLSRISIPPAAAPAGREPDRAARLPLVAGAIALRTIPSAAVLVFVFAVQVLVRGALTTLLVVASIELLDLGESGVGLLNGAIGAGGLLGAVGAIALAGRARLAPAFGLALVGWGLPIAVVGAWPLAPLAVLAMVVLGASNAVLDVAGFTMLQRVVPNRRRVEVFLLLEGLIGIGVAAGGIVAPVLVSTFGTRPALVIVGAVLPLLAALVWRRVRRIDREAVVPERELRLLRAVPMFALLPLTAIERLAGALVPVHLAPGEVLIREGDAGDRFYVLAEGRVAVSSGGTSRGACGPGDGIGEIALIRNVPRTATVTALEPTVALALEASDFLAVVAGHAGSRAAADRLVAERLARS